MYFRVVADYNGPMTTQLNIPASALAAERCAKADGVSDIVKWMDEQLKAQTKAVESARKDRASFGMYEDCGEFYVTRVYEEEARLATMLSWKISTEKYMKKLRHEAREALE